MAESNITQTNIVVAGNERLNPIIRWVGGKRKLIHEILRVIPPYDGCYYEPFLGGATVLLTQLNSKQQFANDANDELINFYEQIRLNSLNVVNLLKSFVNDEKNYYEIRAWDREQNFLNKRSQLERAARFFYLNKTSFQGLWRLNAKKGYNNTPWNKSTKLIEFDEKHIEHIQNFALAIKNVVFSSVDFSELINNTTENDFVYFDPPYIPISKTASFTGYTKMGFNDCHERLLASCQELTKRGTKFLLSNSDCERTRNLYQEFDIITVDVNRTMSAKNSSRGKITEVIVKNY